MRERNILSVLLKDAIPLSRLISILPAMLRIDKFRVRSIDDDDTQEAWVLAETSEMGPGGFATNLTLYIDPKCVRFPSSDLGLAKLLARALKQDVLASPPATDQQIAGNPYAWLLVRPNGDAYKAIQVADSEEDTVMIDYSPEMLEPWIFDS